MYNAHLCTDTAGREGTDVCIMHIYVQIPVSLGIEPGYIVFPVTNNNVQFINGRTAIV